MAKQTGGRLVCGPGSWSEFVRLDEARISGVYVIRSASGACEYVGQSGNIMDRLRAHRATGLLPDTGHSVWISRCGPRDREVLECILIRLLRPPKNKRGRDAPMTEFADDATPDERDAARKLVEPLGMTMFDWENPHPTLADRVRADARRRKPHRGSRRYSADWRQSMANTEMPPPPDGVSEQQPTKVWTSGQR